MSKNKLAFNTGKSVTVTNCQICDNPKLENILFLGYLPPVNTMPQVGSQPKEQPSYPAQVLYCPKCNLVQLGLVVDPKILFPPQYPYTSSTTKVLRENFAELSTEIKSLNDFGLIKLKPNNLIIDIGSNDGNLLGNFKDSYKVLGITPEDVGKEAIQKGIPTIISYFNDNAIQEVLKNYEKAKIITATNVFAHIEDVHSVLDGILKLLKNDGVFISESHYLYSLIKGLQYDTIYHEHLRYYSLLSLKNLFDSHGLEIFHAKKIPTHGGSIRVYAARKGTYPILPTVKKQLEEEKVTVTSKKSFVAFKNSVVLSKIKLYSLILSIKEKGEKIYGISAPSRASTLINYVGIDDGILDCVLEINGSHKIGKYIPGTLIPVLDEEKLFTDQPEYALLLSWHIAEELIPKLREKGYKGKFIVPLPNPKII